MSQFYTEADYENSIIELFRNMGYRYVYAPDLDRDFKSHTFFEGMFEKERLLGIIKNFICFSNEGLKKNKILAGYHQYFAVNKAVQSTKHATETDGKGGVFWHTQG